MDIPEQRLDNLLNQLPKPKERKIFVGGSQFIEQPTLSSECIVYQASSEMMGDVKTMVEAEHKGWNFIEISSDGRRNVHYALAYDPTVKGNTADVSEALGDATLICTVDDQVDTSLVFIRAYHEDRSPITDNEIVQRLALVSGNLHKAGYLEGAGSDSETTPVHTSDGTFLFSLPKRDRGADTQEHVRGVERELDIVDHQENHVTISVHEITGPSGSVFALELPTEYAERRNIGGKEAHDLFNRAIGELTPDPPKGNPFPVLVPLPTTEGEGMTSEPHRLFVVATRGGEGFGSHRADLAKLALTMKELGARVEMTDVQVKLTLDAPVTEGLLPKLDLSAALRGLYAALGHIHGDPDDPTNLRVVSNQRNAYRMTGNTRAFALTVALI